MPGMQGCSLQYVATGPWAGREGAEPCPSHGETSRSSCRERSHDRARSKEAVERCLVRREPNGAAIASSEAGRVPAAWQCWQERHRGTKTARTRVTRAGWAGWSSGAAIISRDKSKASAGASP